MPVKKKKTDENPMTENNHLELPNPSLKHEGRMSTEIIHQIPTNQRDKMDPTKTSSKPEYPDVKTVNPLSPDEEKTWAMLAHFSVLLNLISGFLGGIAAIVIYFVYQDRSRYVAYHAMQAFIFQAITWIGAGMLSGLFISIGAGLGVFILPLLCLIPGFLFLLLIPISLIYGIIGGVQVINGEDFRYWQVGNWVRNILEPDPLTK